MTRFELHIGRGDEWYIFNTETNARYISLGKVVDKLNEQQEFIEELQVSDEMGWKRAEHFEKKCPKELHNKKMYIKRLEYKVQKFKEENEQLKKENRMLKKDLNKLYNLLIDKGMSHNELQDVLWGIDDE